MKPKYFFICCAALVLMYFTFGGVTNTKPDVKLLNVAGWEFGINYSRYFFPKLFVIAVMITYAALISKASSKEKSNV